jgi:GDP-4-dehydro-6-deoxy-D-mannose reductase
MIAHRENPPPRLLVTGRHGFVGETLSRVMNESAERERWTLIDAPVGLDLRDAASTMRLVAEARPDAVLHLAAQSAVPESFRDPEATLQINLIGTLHLLQALAGGGFRGRFVYVGTGEVYGLVPASDLPIAETRLPRPRNPYAVSKLAAEALCWQWHVSNDMDLVIARPFNHIGPGQSERFAISDFARQIAEIKRGRRPSIVHAGNLDVTRDFTDVRDVVGAYFALLDRGQSGEVYNVCSGTEASVGSLLQQLIALAGVEATIEHDPLRARRSEQPRMCGDPGKIRAATGWTPITPIRSSLATALQFWEGRLARG